MNPIPPENALPAESSSPPPAPPSSHTQSPVADWFRQALASNPCYIISAALLLYGVYRLSIDPSFLGAETPKLIFNFSALQVYELLLTAVAIFLARRRIWYDSTLLVVLESALVLVAFILVTQAVLTGRALALTLCLGGALLVITRFAALRRFYEELNLPPALLGCGLAVLVANLALPFIFRPIMEKDVQDWEIPSHYGWLVVLPLLQLLGLLLPRPRQWGGEAMQRSWLPWLIFTLWIAASGVHLYCVGYVCNLTLYPFLLVPVLWAAAWTLYGRATDFVPAPLAQLRAMLLLPPALLTLGAIEFRHVFLPLTAVNGVVFGALWLTRREGRLAGYLMQASLVVFLAAMPDSWGRLALPDFSRERWTMLCGGGWLLVQAVRSRRAELALFGAVFVALVPPVFLRVVDFHVSCQAGLVFLLLHSLRWNTQDQAGAVALRTGAAIAWVMEALVWASSLSSLAVWQLSIGTALVLSGCLLARWLTGRWETLVLPIAAVLVALAAPLHLLARNLKHAHPGVLALTGSFMLLGAGTALALTKHRWHRLNKQPAAPGARPLVET